MLFQEPFSFFLYHESNFYWNIVAAAELNLKYLVYG